MLESDITQKIMHAVRAAYPRAIVRKRHGTVFGIAGDPDLYGSIDGRHFEIEVKQPGESPTLIQRKRLRDWSTAGAIVGVAASVDEALAILRTGLKGGAHDRAAL